MIGADGFPVTQSVSGPFLTDAELRGTPVPVSGPLTDAQLRAASVPVSGTFFQATQPVSASALPLPAGASTEATLAAIKAKTDNLDAAISTRLKPADTLTKVATVDTITNPVAVTGAFWPATQPVSIAAMPSTPVTGTFWQATQPVSGPLTDTQLRATAVPVSGFPAWPYPATVTPVAAHSAVAANAVASAPLAAAAAKFTYLTSIQIFGTGATATSVVLATITGLLGGTLTIPVVVPAGINLAVTPILLNFDTPLRSSAVNTAIVVTLPALGLGNIRATVNAQGFQQ